MKEQKFVCKPVMIQAICDCGGILLVDQSAPMLTSYPPQIKHVCNKCGKVEYLQKIYPSMAYEIGDPIEEKPSDKIIK